MNRRGFGSVPAKERTYRLILQEEEITILSPYNLYRFSLDSGEWNLAPLAEWLFDAVQISLAAGTRERLLYVGFNRGELPGGLKLINGDTGQIVTVDGRQPVSGILPDPGNGSMIISAGCCHRSLEFGGLHRVSGERMQSIYRESAIFDLKTSGDSLIAAGKNSILCYNGDRILSGSPGGFSDIKGLMCSD